LIIYYSTKKLEKQCNKEALGNKAFGLNLARKIRQRLKEFEAASSLQVISKLPPARCHELKGDRKGSLAVDLTDKKRLVFVPDHTPIPLLPTGGLDWSAVTQIIIMEVTDYHGD